MTPHDDGYDPPDTLRHLPSWLTSEVSRRAHRLVAEALAHEDARRQHFTVLTSLAEQGAASQATLGRRLSIDRSDLHALVTELERDGLVARDRDPDDGRRNVVTLTAAGAAARKRLDRRVQEAQRELLEPLSPSERRELIRLLELLVTSTL